MIVKYLTVNYPATFLKCKAYQSEAHAMAKSVFAVEF
jgi:hypothetical protein